MAEDPSRAARVSEASRARDGYRLRRFDSRGMAMRFDDAKGRRRGGVALWARLLQSEPLSAAKRAPGRGRNAATPQAASHKTRASSNRITAVDARGHRRSFAPIRRSPRRQNWRAFHGRPLARRPRPLRPGRARRCRCGVSISTIWRGDLAMMAPRGEASWPSGPRSLAGWCQRAKASARSCRNAAPRHPSAAIKRTSFTCPRLSPSTSLRAGRRGYE